MAVTTCSVVPLTEKWTGGCNPPGVKVREAIKLIEGDGWFQIGQKGSHRQFKHPSKKGRVTVSGNLGHELPKGTLASILRQAQLEDADE